VPVDTPLSVPAVYPFFATTLAPFAAAAASMLKASAMATDLASAAPFLMTMSYSRLSARMVTSHLYSMPSVPVSVFLKIMRSKETFLARSSLMVMMCIFNVSVIDGPLSQSNSTTIFTWNEVSAKRGLGIGEHVDGGGTSDNLVTVLVNPRDACGSLGVDDSSGTVLVLEDVLLQVGASLLHGAVELRLHLGEQSASGFE
jgi:hypothetical protein